MSKLKKQMKGFYIFNIVFSVFLIWLFIPIIWLVFSIIHLYKINKATDESFLSLKKDISIGLAVMLLTGNFFALIGLWFSIEIPNTKVALKNEKKSAK